MKGKLRLAQEAHARRMSALREWLTAEGIGYSEGDAFRDPRVHGEFGESTITVGGVTINVPYGHAFSCHKLKLADDLNFIDPKDHIKAHDQWDRIGGAKRLLHDMNHYSSGWEGYV